MKKIYYLREEKGNEKKKNQKETSSIIINAIDILVSAASIYVSIRLFQISRDDVESIRAQDRNDFYAINSSMLKYDSLEPIKFSSSELHRLSNRDSMDLELDVNFKNISKYRCDILSLINLKHDEDINIYNILSDSIPEYVKKYSIDYKELDYTEQNYSLLPNETNVIRPKYNLSIRIDNTKEYFVSDVFILYKNAIGGYYLTNFQYYVKLKREKSSSEYDVTFEYLGSSFRIFRTNEFDFLNNKIKKMPKYVPYG